MERRSRGRGEDGKGLGEETMVNGEGGRRSIEGEGRGERNVGLIMETALRRRSITGMLSGRDVGGGRGEVLVARYGL